MYENNFILTRQRFFSYVIFIFHQIYVVCTKENVFSFFKYSNDIIGKNVRSNLMCIHSRCMTIFNVDFLLIFYWDEVN